MAVEVARTGLHWPPLQLPGGHLPPKSLASVFSSLHTNSPRYGPDRGGSIAYHIHHQLSFLGAGRLLHCQASEYLNQRGRARRGGGGASSSASLDDFVNDDENGEDGFVNRLNELALQFNSETGSENQEAETSSNGTEADLSISSSNPSSQASPSIPPISDEIFPLPLSRSSEIPSMLSDSWPNCEGFMPESLERLAGSVNLPLSLRILKKKKKKRWDAAELTDSAYSSFKKAFSSMVFIVRELQSHTIRMREALFFLDTLQIQGILTRVHGELHASFVWLFQRIFSATPTLMVYLMLLLANFTVYSIASGSVTAVEAYQPLQSVVSSVTESFQTNRRIPSHRFDSSSIKTFSVSRSATVGGSGTGGGGGQAPTIAGASDDGRSDRSSSSLRRDSSIYPDAPSTTATEEDDDPAITWKRMLETVETMKANDRHEALMDPDTLRRFVSPVTANTMSEDLSVYSATELSYRRALAEDPQNPLLLTNFAQFLYLVLQDHDRAEEYFKKAARAEPADAESLNRYANFLWVARNDLGAAEETFLEAIAADPGNSYYSANYAHFLWSTGGEDTCYPLDGCDT
ncbi:hypothetical protein AXF42_Ash007911 [Apostasia shenzhenica]|uniref:Uncharacterized protein n=1 Tax=Apostasia shenzhenica TaxID=1088818 RepID=A0A2I0B5Q6_9ASPA|nr:hypothetical protein AXF42_Ash007911 [Apostasia shenzhenica]